MQRLSQDEGINLAGIKRIIELENQVAALQSRVAELATAVEGAGAALQAREAAVHASYRRDLVPYQPAAAVQRAGGLAAPAVGEPCSADRHPTLAVGCQLMAEVRRVAAR